jgi:hypothetical protein
MRILYHPKRILGFETYVAPEGFDRKAQPVDIYDVFERYYKNHRTAKFIYSVADSYTSVTPLESNNMILCGGSSYLYSYKLSGVRYKFDVGSTYITSSFTAGYYTSITVDSTASFPSSGKVYFGREFLGGYNATNNIFIYTSKDETHFYGVSQYLNSTNIGSPYFSDPNSFRVEYIIEWQGTERYVIVNDTRQISIPAYCYSPGIVWMYCGNRINSVYAAAKAQGVTSSLKYIHVHKLDDITSYGYSSQGSYFTGQLYLSRTPTTIDSLSFTGCSLLIGTLTIPSNIKQIRSLYGTSGAFAGCTGLTSVVFEEGLELIGYTAFSGCTGLNGTLTIPNSCTVIEYNAFYNCNKLDTLDLGTGVITIGNSAFQACAQLSGTLVLPDSLTTIGTLAFYGCTSFSGTLTIPLNVTSIGQGAFGDDNFSDIDVTANSRYEDVDDVLYEISTRTALHSIKGDTGTITFQTNTLILGDYCCLRNQRTGTLTVPDSVTRVGIYAFYDCNGFTAISLEASSSSLTTIDDYAFSHCSSLVGTLTIPNSVTLVDTGAFQDDVLITSLSLGSGLVTIGANAFRQMTAITENLVIPNSVETIGATAFYNNTARTGTLTLGTGLKTIGGQAFAFNPLTGTLTIPSAVTAIGEGAFCNNNFLAVASSASGFTVSDYVLYDETVSGQIKAHTSVRGYSGTLTLKAGTTSVLLYCFYDNDSRSGAITIPYTVTAIGQQAFDNCGGFNDSVTIGDGTNDSALTSIGYLAFRSCANITRWNIYAMTAPTCSSSFSNYAKELHIQSGTTGYDVTPATAAAPWTNTAIFSSVTADL